MQINANLKRVQKKTNKILLKQQDLLKKEL